MLVIEVVHYKSFKEKIRITKKLTGKFKVEDLENLIYIEREIAKERSERIMGEKNKWEHEKYQLYGFLSTFNEEKEKSKDMQRLLDGIKKIVDFSEIRKIVDLNY